MSPKVLIAGGGVAALEAALALRELAGERAAVEICSPRAEFVYRPAVVTEPFGESRTLHYDVARLAAGCGAEFRRVSIGAVDPGARLARTLDGEEIPYDELVVACGSRLLAGVPGAITFWGVVEDERVRAVIDALLDGRIGRLAFVVPAGGSWALPVYELALRAQLEAREAGLAAAEIAIVTPEQEPLGVFGRRASERTAELLAERGIELFAAATPVRFEDGTLSVSPQAAVAADAVISMPHIEGRRIGGIPHDDHGFVAVDEHCRVRGLEHVYAAGDVADFPVKQGGLAAQQADVAAEAIAAALGAALRPRPFDPVLRGVLWTGAEPLFLSADLAGGHGETSSAGSEPAWSGGPEQKIVGRYIAEFLAAR